MIDDAMTKAFFLESGSPQLEKIYNWARARYAAPWAVLFAVLLRVAASVPPHVQLPGVIGGRASLNLLCAFVSPSGGGKGISDKVARLAWPTPIVELPIGSGEGIAETFTVRGKETEDNERITSALFTCSEIDILTGLDSRQGSTILGTLKAFAMGEQFGSTNATKANSRNVTAHSYRGCLSVGAQPGHTGVIFRDTSGGTPQRFLWALTIDPDMPATLTADPAPLDTTTPSWTPGKDGVVEIIYGHDAINETIVTAHLARQRGEADSLDGHAMLTRCKVAGIISAMHGRCVVGEWEWDRAGDVMAVSDATREWIVGEARRAERERVRAKAVSRATGEDFYDASRLETVKRSLLRMLDRDGEQQGNMLRSRLGRKEKRELFDQAMGLLEVEGLVSQMPGMQKGARYRLTGQGDHVGQGGSSQVSDPDHVGQGDHSATVTDLDTRRSDEPERQKVPCPVWLSQYVEQLRGEGETRISSFAVYQAGAAAGHSKGSVGQAIDKHPDMVAVGREGRSSIFSLTGETTGYKPCTEWVHDYIDALPGIGHVVDKEHLRQAAESAGHGWDAAAQALRESGRVDQELDPNNRRRTVWRIAAPKEDTA